MMIGKLKRYIKSLIKGGETSLDHENIYEDQEDFSNKNNNKDIKILAYYLPQFHPIPENDKWHGKGFTEWTKVKAAKPLFDGHYQPHIPHENIGYYILDNSDVLKRQALDMKKACVYGMIFYHYWFSGKLILEKPAQLLLASKDIEMPFAFCWANENWTRRWDGEENNVLLKQIYSINDAAEFIKYLIPFFKDDRYIKINNRPLLFIYRANLIDSIQGYIDVFAKECSKENICPPYIVAVQTRGVMSPGIYGMDAAVERTLFDWGGGKIPSINKEVNTNISNPILDYSDVKDYYCSIKKNNDYICFRSIVPNWDNTARYNEQAHIVHNSNPKIFEDWLDTIIEKTKELPEDQRFIVINAWNEWGEGNHLEPDVRNGYANLNAVGRAMSKGRDK